VDADAAASGDLGYTVGTATFTARRDGAPSVAHTAYLTVWKRQPGGEWKYVFDGGVGTPPP
jgi:ketosteroid isomerase-like protein